jgi:hypothetical protein
MKFPSKMTVQILFPLVNKLTGKVTPQGAIYSQKLFLLFPVHADERNKNREKSLKLLLDSPEPTPIFRES